MCSLLKQTPSKPFKESNCLFFHRPRTAQIQSEFLDLSADPHLSFFSEHKDTNNDLNNNGHKTEIHQDESEFAAMLEKEAEKVVKLLEEDLNSGREEMMKEQNLNREQEETMKGLLPDEELESVAFDFEHQVVKKEPVIMQPLEQTVSVIPHDAQVETPAQPKLKIQVIPHDAKNTKAKSQAQPKVKVPSVQPRPVNKGTYSELMKKQAKVQQPDKIAKKPNVTKNPSAIQARPRWR